jgi:excisionase family DNA binding protein
MAQRVLSPTTQLTPAQQQALASFNALLTAREEPPQRLIIVAGDRERELPTDALAELLPAVAAATRLLAPEADREGFPDDRELTTTQAALWMRVSRQHLVDLLKAGAIPYRKVGAHHRVRVGDLREFKERQRAALREITRIGEELGYDE